MSARRAGWRERYLRAVEPAPDGLPNRRVLLIPLGLVALLLAGLVLAGWTGSSTGQYNQYFSDQADSRIVLGESQPIRSDEWLVQTPWTISQVEQGLPSVNGTFPGGMDATVQHDLPSKNWATAFRPHLWGFFVMPLDHAMALKWWLPPLAMVAAAFFFVITLMPRRPVGALALAAAFFWAPFFQWWFLSITFWPVAWALLTMGAVVWMMRRPRLRTAAPLAALSGYLIVATGTGIYAPFIIPCALVAALFVVAVVWDGAGVVGTTLRDRLRRVAPLLVGSFGAMIVMGVWVLTRLDTIELFTSTVYPGQRLTPPGEADSLFDVRSLLGGVVAKDLDVDGVVTHLGSNSSEASSYFLPGLFLVVTAIWLVVRRWRVSRRIDWIMVSMLIAGVIFLAYLFLPGWDPVSHLLLLDRSTVPRMRIGIGLLAVVLMVLVAWRIDEARAEESPVLPPWWTVAVAGLLVAGTSAAVIRSLQEESKTPLVLSYLVVAVAVLYLATVVLGARGFFTASAIAFLAISLASSSGVNPLYKGVYDLNDTRLVKTMKSVDRSADANWVGIGLLSSTALVESGLRSYGGFQSAPSKEMWKDIDPPSRYPEIWNRLGLVLWNPGPGEPVPTNPGLDQVLLNFDPCSTFAQQHVTYVLSDALLEPTCTRELDMLPYPGREFRIYEVVPRTA